MSFQKTSPLFALIAIAGCASAPEPAAKTPPAPLPVLARADDPPVWSDPTRRPYLAMRTPAGWTEAVSQEKPGETVLIHDSGEAMITVALRPTDSRSLGDIAEDMLVDLGPDVSGSGITVTASGDEAWFGWARHPSPMRTHGAHGKVRLVRFPTMPERMAVVSGIWPYGRGAEFADAFDLVARSVQLR